MTQSKERFTRVFELNITHRSRTAKGRDESAKTSSHKKPLLLSGRALRKQVQSNTQKLIATVLENIEENVDIPEHSGYIESYPSIAHTIRERCETWFATVNHGLLDFEAYDCDFEALFEESERLSLTTGIRYSLNPRYRLWTPPHTTMQLPPILLEEYMEDFYAQLAWRFDKPIAEQLAWADTMMDGELYPWLDGCSRVSTALVMWISGLNKSPPPLFATTKQGHYDTLRNFPKHVEYYTHAIQRGAELEL